MNYTPAGIFFWDRATKHLMVLIEEGQRFAGWIARRVPNGHWVTVRKATAEDRAAVRKAMGCADEKDESHG